MDYSVYKEFKLKNNYNVILKIHCEKKGQTKQTKLFHIYVSQKIQNNF